MPTLSELEEWIEEQIPRNLVSIPPSLSSNPNQYHHHSLTHSLSLSLVPLQHDLPSKLHETLSIYYESLYHELTRYGSPLPSISLPDLSSLGLPTLSQIEQTLPFNTNCTSSPSVQAPPPPVGFIQKTSNHLSNHSGKYLTTSLTIGLGLTLWYAYGRGFNNSRSLKGKGRESNVAHSNGYWFDWKGLNRKRKARVERGLRREAVGESSKLSLWMERYKKQIIEVKPHFFEKGPVERKSRVKSSRDSSTFNSCADLFDSFCLSILLKSSFSLTSQSFSELIHL